MPNLILMLLIIQVLTGTFLSSGRFVNKNGNRDAKNICITVGIGVNNNNNDDDDDPITNIEKDKDTDKECNSDGGE